MEDQLCVANIFFLCGKSWADRLTDVLALLIIGFFLVVAFFFWERYIINNTTRPPLMRLQLWTRAKGRLASVYFIGFVAWMGFTVCVCNRDGKEVFKDAS